MDHYIQIGNQIINLELLTNVHFVPKVSDLNRSLLVLYFGNSEGGTQIYDIEAEQLWRFLSRSALNITPVQTAEDEAIAP